MSITDEMLKSFLPLQYKDGPDYCAVTDASGCEFAITMRPELMRAMEAALADSGDGVVVPSELTPAIACALEGCDPPEKQSPKAIEALLIGYRDTWRSVLAASNGANVAPGWQSIETAPKDGREIIGVYHRPAEGTLKATTYGPWTIAFHRNEWRSSWDNSEVISSMGDFGTEYKEPDVEPTHWMPLPAAPQPGGYKP